MSRRRAAQELPAAVAELACKHGLDPARLLGWAVRADGSVVILAADGRKYHS